MQTLAASLIFANGKNANESLLLRRCGLHIVCEVQRKIEEAGGQSRPPLHVLERFVIWRGCAYLLSLIACWASYAHLAFAFSVSPKSLQLRPELELPPLQVLRLIMSTMMIATMAAIPVLPFGSLWFAIVSLLSLWYGYSLQQMCLCVNNLSTNKNLKRIVILYKMTTGVIICA